MVSLQDVEDIINNGRVFYNNVHIDLKDYKIIDNFLSDVYAIVTATEVSEKGQQLFKVRPDLKAIFGFARQELDACRKCIAKKDNLKDEKVVCREISIHLSRLAKYIPQVRGIVLEDAVLQDSVRAVSEHSQSNAEEKDSDEYWHSLR
jgi:hypothetical protein